MKFEIVHISRGNIRLKSGDKYVRVLGEALVASGPTDSSYVIYLNTMANWETPPGVALTATEKQEIIDAIRENFQRHGSIIEFE